MAGGKETPRQRMIGMMYLVLTALLALNVTKEVVNAFVTINDKLDASAEIVNNKVGEDYRMFDQKRATLEAQKEDLTEFNMWNGKADTLELETRTLVSYLLTECSDMIEEAEGNSWVANDGTDEDGFVTKLKPLFDIEVKDNYDIPTQLFIGSNPMEPIERGNELTNRIHAYRDRVAIIMAAYTKDEKKYSFTPPTSAAGLSEALRSVHPEDSSRIAHFYHSLTVPETLYDSGEEKEVPWVSATFNHAPIVAAAAMFTSLKVDVKNAESIACEYLLSKVIAPIFVINKIEPMAFANSGYINQGDSLSLKVMIAAYDSTSVNKIRWGMDDDTLPERWTETQGGLNLDGAEVGFHKVKGAIGIKERGNTVWKPWEFDYTVGAPMGAISQPNMRLLYRGYNNEIEAAASGFPADKVSISASSGCSVSRGTNGKWIVKVGAGIRTATLTVRGQKEDGSVVTVASNTFEVKQLPKPEIFLGGIAGGQRPGCSSVRAQTRISLRYGEGIPLTGVNFNVISGFVSVEGLVGDGRINGNGALDDKAKQLLTQACGGKKVTITVKYVDPSGTQKNANPLIFTVR
ncbi:MAG: hypothetical protein GQ574_19895 [Crocinitomix sp.]|nr:hypothetical protein [Crocinitomix sp.]